MTVKRQRLLRTILIAVGIGLGIYLVVGVLLAGRGTLPLLPTNQPMLISNGIVSNHRISTKSWSFRYKKAQLSADGSVADLDGLYDGVFYKQGKPIVLVSAEHATLNTITYDFSATGRVHIQRIGTNQSFDTDSMVWTNSTKRLQLDHPSYLHTGNQVLVLHHVTLDLRNNTMNIGSIEGNLIP